MGVVWCACYYGVTALLTLCLGDIRGLSEKVRIGRNSRRNTELAHGAMPSAPKAPDNDADQCALSAKKTS